jgi:hypothetical protein
MAGPALVALAALLACAVGEIPLGTGRTDEVLYPAILLLVASGVEAIQQNVTGRVKQYRSMVIAVALGVVLVAALLVVSGVRVDPKYPAENTKQINALLNREIKPGDRVLVDPYLRYTWAYYNDKNLHLEFGRSWAASFSVISTQPRVSVASLKSPLVATKSPHPSG